MSVVLPASGRALPSELEEERARIEALARSYGLDFFETVFEMCTYEEINMVAAYGGFPTRYPHWRFGMEYLELQKSYEYGLSKIYELVINNDPAIAYLMDCNHPTDQKLVMAHVYGHVDFFKNNLWFAPTNRKMLDQMANHATRVRELMDRYGVDEVERFIDQCLSLDNLIDPYLHPIRRDGPPAEEEAERPGPARFAGRPYMDRYLNPPEALRAEREAAAAELARAARIPEEPVRDVLGFLLQHAPLPRWKHEILAIVREEALYFAPQGQTKIMNEGWATYWHTRLLTRHVLDDGEIIDFADVNSGTLAMAPGQLNPYKLGVELWRHIEARWDRGRFGKDWLDCEDPEEQRRWDTGAGLGRQKVFQVRQTHNDVSFVDEFLTADFCREQGFFASRFDARSNLWVVDSHQFDDIKRNLLQMLVSRGTPRVFVVDANHGNRGELRLLHQHEGVDLQLDWASATLANLASLWSRPVHLDTLLEGKPLRLSHDGSAVSRTALKEGG